MAGSVQNRCIPVTKMEVSPDAQCPICYVIRAEEIEKKINAVWVGHRKDHVYHADCLYRWTQRDVTQLSRCPSLLCMENLDIESIRPFISKKPIYQEHIEQLKESLQEHVEQLKESLPSLSISATSFSGTLSCLRVMFELAKKGEITIPYGHYYIIPSMTAFLFPIIGMCSTNPSYNTLPPKQTLILVSLIVTAIYSSVFFTIDEEFLQEIGLLNPNLNEKEKNTLISLIHFNIFSFFAAVVTFRNYFNERDY
ncbi:MAG: hypothetical protein Q8L98_08275 [Chlamydiales bacterium]|nr:hypothetical protein [Chlamydiales bacterium]